ncbi:MAG TPA: NifU family protein [Phycisphaerae bacterium]|nr:NifU family protein [Phycisphaerae bacterium]
MHSDDTPAGASTPSLKERVNAVIESIRPMIQGDGGDVELVGVDDHGVVQVRFHGACVGCMAASMTLSQGIERNLMAQVPEVTRVVLV